MATAESKTSAILGPMPKPKIYLGLLIIIDLLFFIIHGIKNGAGFFISGAEIDEELEFALKYY